jgi:hypothetical protein
MRPKHSEPKCKLDELHQRGKDAMPIPAETATPTAAVLAPLKTSAHNGLSMTGFGATG